MTFVRRKRVGAYEYYQLVESRWMNGKPRQRVLLHLGRYTTVEAALEGWPQEIEGLQRFASQRQEKAERLKKERSSEAMVKTALERAQKAENLAEEIAAKLGKLRELKDQGEV